MSDFLKDLRAMTPEEQYEVFSNGGRYYVTVGELKAALADIADDTQIAMRGHGGGQWVRGVVLSDRDLTRYGEGSDAMTIDTSQGKHMFKNWRGKKKAIKALGFDTYGL